MDFNWNFNSSMNLCRRTSAPTAAWIIRLCSRIHHSTTPFELHRVFFIRAFSARSHTLRLDYELCGFGCLFYSISVCRKFNWSNIHMKLFELLGCLQRMLSMPTGDYSKRTSSYQITSSKWENFFSAPRKIQIEQMVEQLFTFRRSQRKLAAQALYAWFSLNFWVI